MKYRWLIASFLILALILVCVAGGFALWQGAQIVSRSGVDILSWSAPTITVSGVDEQRLTVGNELELHVTSWFGNISVEAGDGDELFIRAEKSVRASTEEAAQSALDGLKVVVEQQGNRVTIKAQEGAIDESLMYFGPLNRRINYTITVPRETKVKLVSAEGKILLAGTNGSAELRTEFGAIEVARFKGALNATTSNGSLNISKIESDGHVAISSMFGEIIAEEIVAGSLEIVSVNGTIRLNNFNVEKRAGLESQFGGITVENGQAGSVNVITNNGRVAMNKIQVAEKVYAKGGFGDMTISQVFAGEYELETQNGNVTLDEGKGKVKINSGFGNIEVLNMQDARLDLSSQNGAITFSGSLGEGSQTIESEFGDIKISLPGDTTLNFDLKAEFGSIKSDFEITVSGDLNPNHWIGRIGQGGEKLTVRTQNGSIRLFKID